MNKPSFKKLGVGKRMPGDPLFKNGDTACRMYIREGIIDIDDEQLNHKLVPVFPCEVIGCPETFSTVMEFEMHYNSRHRFICTQCRKPLPSAHFLDLHLSECHDSFFAAQAERKPMFRCLVEECSVVSQDVQQRRTHCIEVHSFPPDFRYDPSHSKSSKGNHKNDSKAKSSESEKMVVDEVQKVRPDVRKQFTFGHVNRGKAFSVGNRSKPPFPFGNNSKAPFSFGKKSKAPFSFGKKSNTAFGNKSDSHQLDQEMSDKNKESASSFGKKSNSALDKFDTHQVDQEMSDQKKESPYGKTSNTALDNKSVADQEMSDQNKESLSSFGEISNTALNNKSDTHRFDQEMSDQNKESPEEIPEVESMDTHTISDA